MQSLVGGLVTCWAASAAGMLPEHALEGRILLPARMTEASVSLFKMEATKTMASMMHHA